MQKNWWVLLVAASTAIACSDPAAARPSAATPSRPVVAAASASPAPPGPCQPTGLQAFGPGQAMVGGNLALMGPSLWRVAIEEKGRWFWRTSDHTKRLVLKLERIDAATATRTKDLGPPQPNPDGTVFPAEWGGGLVYGGYFGHGGPTLPEAGCWRLSVMGGATDDAVVIQGVSSR